jgi:hypothetical protein
MRRTTYDGHGGGVRKEPVMTTMTLTTTRRTAWPVGLGLGSAAGAALVVAGVWNALVQEHVTVSSPPMVGPQTPPLQTMQAQYRWYATTVPQERSATILGLIGVAGLVLLTVELRRRLRDAPVGRGACTAVQAAGTVWIVGALAAMGGHRSVALMATHDNPVQTVNVVAFTTDMTSDAFNAAAFVLLAVGMLGVATASYGGPRWRALTVLTGLLAAVVAYGYVASVDSVTTYELGLLAAVLQPIWLVWTGRLLDRSEPTD